MPKKPKISAYLALFAATAIWAAAGPVIKLTLGYIPVITFLFLRFLIVCILVLPFLLIELKRNPINKKDIKNFVILGLLSQSALIIPFYGYKYTRAIDAALIAVTYPIMAVAAGNYFYKEVVTKMEKLGMSLATLGAGVIMIEPVLASTGVTKASGMAIFGNLLIFLYQVTWVAYIIWSKSVMGEKSIQLKKLSKKLSISPMSKKYSPGVISMFSFFVGLTTFIPLIIIENTANNGLSALLIHKLGVTPILGILYMALLSSIVAYMLFQWGLHRVEVTDAALFTYLAPVLAFPVAYVLLREVPSSATGVGTLLIAVGILIAEKHKS